MQKFGFGFPNNKETPSYLLSEEAFGDEENIEQPPFVKLKVILCLKFRFLPSSNKCRESYCILTTEISFQEVSQQFLNKMEMSR